jgi:hypothetical protein
MEQNICFRQFETEQTLGTFNTVLCAISFGRIIPRGDGKEIHARKYREN